MSYRACQGQVFAGSDTTIPATLVGYITGYDVAETAEEIDVSVMGDCTKQYLAGPLEVAITLDGFSRHIPSTDVGSTQDPGQALFVPGAKNSVAIQPAGTGSGKPRLEWTSVTVTGRTFAGVVDGVPTWNIEARANVATDDTAQV